MTQPVDCVVVGAGFAGLVAADELTRGGHSVVVLEARERAGGRTHTITLDDGTPIDVGGQWLGPTQDEAYALCRRFGRQTYPMHTAGHNLLDIGGRMRRYRGHIPLRAPLWTLANLGWVLARLHQLAQRVPLDAPWTAPNARELDQRTLGDWVRANVPEPGARSMVEIGIAAVFAAEPDELSLLHALFYMRSGGSFDMLTKSEGGAQQDRIRGGVEPLADDLVSAIRDAGGEVVFEAPVTSLEQDAAGVTVRVGEFSYRGRNVIVAVPPPIASELAYQPALPIARRELLSRTPMGSVIKCIAVYDQPFWRNAGLSGSAVTDAGPMKAVFDASPESGRPAVLMGFLEGAEARRLAKVPESERREIALSTFARLFGGDAMSPTAYVDRAWTEEPFSRGCYAALFPPGVWTQVGHVIRAPFGLIHWAGTETATHWNGYIEGAIRSGQRAAREVSAGLGQDAPDIGAM